MDDGATEIADAELAAVLRRQGRRIRIQALVIAALAAPLLLLL